MKYRNWLVVRILNYSLNSNGIYRHLHVYQRPKMQQTTLLFHPSVPCSKLIKMQANIMVQRCQKCYRGTYFNDVMYIALL